MESIIEVNIFTRNCKSLIGKICLLLKYVYCFNLFGLQKIFFSWQTATIHLIIASFLYFTCRLWVFCSLWMNGMERSVYNHSYQQSVVGNSPGKLEPLEPAFLKGDPQNAPKLQTYHQEAYYLYFVAVLGLLLNILVAIFIFIRRTMRKLTSAFLVHACFLDSLKAAYCIPIANNLITQIKPSDCDFFGASYVLIITASIFNMVAMVCTEAYTFGEVNIGGNSHGSVCCIIFGIILVYIASTILHLGPTLIGGYFDFHPQIGSCSFVLGKQTGYVAHVMWIIIITLAVLFVIHFICKLYKEIQMNHPNRVSMLVRSSITITDNPLNSTCNIRNMIKDSSQRAKMFVLSTIAFVLCWYPLFLLILVDSEFKQRPKMYQAFSFIAWTQGTIQPILYICFDRHIDLLAKYIYCDRYRQASLVALADWMNTQAAINREEHQEEGETQGQSDYATGQGHSGIEDTNSINMDDCISALSSRSTYRSRPSHEATPESNSDNTSSLLMSRAEALTSSNPQIRGDFRISCWPWVKSSDHCWSNALFTFYDMYIYIDNKIIHWLNIFLNVPSLYFIEQPFNFLSVCPTKTIFSGASGEIIYLF